MSTEKPRDIPFQIIKGEGYTTVKLQGYLEPETAKILETEVPNLIAQPFQHLVFNCDNLSGISKPWIRSLLTLTREIKKINKDIRFILVSTDVNALFKAEGVDQVFKICLNLRDALVQFGLVTKKTLDTDFINPFLNATIQVLKIQTMTQSKPGKIFVKTEKDKFSGDISGIIGLVSESFNGSVVISFPEATFLKIISRMLGENYQTLTKEIADGAGELTNIIFGQAKVILNEKGYGIKTALPSVVTGKEHSVVALTKGPIVVVPFETDVGPFFVEICLSG